MHTASHNRSGIRNEGQTCHLNAAVQCLLSCHSFASALHEADPRHISRTARLVRECQNTLHNNVTARLLHLIADLELQPDRGEDMEETLTEMLGRMDEHATDATAAEPGVAGNWLNLFTGVLSFIAISSPLLTFPWPRPKACMLSLYFQNLFHIPASQVEYENPA